MSKINTAQIRQTREQPRDRHGRFAVISKTVAKPADIHTISLGSPQPASFTQSVAIPPDWVAEAARSEQPWESGVGWHYSGKSNGLSLDRQYIQTSGMFPKPRGLWLSWETATGEGGWGEWCDIESFGSTEHRLMAAVDLDRLLTLDSPDDIPAEFRKPVDGWFVERECQPDWAAMADSGEWAGVSVPNYVKGYPCPLWWSGWDVSSACVWDLSAVTWAQPPPGDR